MYTFRKLVLLFDEKTEWEDVHVVHTLFLVINFLIWDMSWTNFEIERNRKTKIEIVH